MSSVRSENVSTFHTGQPHVPIGELLVNSGKLTELDVGRVVTLQKQEKLRFGEAAEQMGLLRQEDIQIALAEQFNYPYVGQNGANISQLLVAACDPFSAKAEAIRRLRSQLALRWFDDQRKTIMVASPRGQSGASVIAGNLAIAYAQMGERTLLVDANLRRPSHHRLFGLETVDGLSTLLAERSSFRDLLQGVEPFEMLALLCAGASPPNPHELLSAVRFSYLIETASAAFDVVIVDAPPLLEYSDGQAIAARTGGCLLVTRRHKTSLSDVSEAKLLLEPTGASIVGAVLND